jgi:hypothetical protein
MSGMSLGGIPDEMSSNEMNDIFIRRVMAIGTWLIAGGSENVPATLEQRWSNAGATLDTVPNRCTSARSGTAWCISRCICQSPMVQSGGGRECTSMAGYCSIHVHSPPMWRAALAPDTAAARLGAVQGVRRRIAEAAQAKSHVCGSLNRFIEETSSPPRGGGSEAADGALRGMKVRCGVCRG